MKPRIIFTHIPKTAGTSFKEELIKSNFKNVFMYKGRKSLFKIHLTRPKFITGHVPFGIINRFLRNEYEYLTFLRAPVERAISHYYFILQSKSSVYEHPKFQDCKNISLEKAYSSGKLADNLQTRFISGEGYNAQKCNSNMLSLAKQNLKKHYPVFGILEQYDKSLELISRRYNLTIPPKKQSTFFKKTEKPLIDEEVKAALRDHHLYDIEFYEYAVDLFGEIKKQYSESIKSSVL